MLQRAKPRGHDPQAFPIRKRLRRDTYDDVPEEECQSSATRCTRPNCIDRFASQPRIDIAREMATAMLSGSE